MDILASFLTARCRPGGVLGRRGAAADRQGLAKPERLCHISRSTSSGPTICRHQRPTIAVPPIWCRTPDQDEGWVPELAGIQPRDESWQVGLYVAAVLIPLAAFAVEAIFIRQLKRTERLHRHRRDRVLVPARLIGFLDYTCREQLFLTWRMKRTPARARRRRGRRPRHAAEAPAPPQAARLVGELRLGRPGGHRRRRAQAGGAGDRGPTWSCRWASRSTT